MDFLGRVLERQEASWWRCVECSGRCYLSCTVHQLPLFQLLMTWSQRLFPQGPRKEKINKRLFLSSALIYVSPSLSRGSICSRGEKNASQKSVHSHATAASKIISLCLLCCIYIKNAALSAASVLRCSDNQKSLWDVNEQYFTARHTPASLWSVCTAEHRLTGEGVSQACWEHDGGPDLPAGGPA